MVFLLYQAIAYLLRGHANEEIVFLLINRDLLGHHSLTKSGQNISHPESGEILQQCIKILMVKSALSGAFGARFFNHKTVEGAEELV